MDLLYKALFCLITSGVTFGALFYSYGHWLQPTVFSALVCIATAVILYLESKDRLDFDGEPAICVSFGLFLGLASAFFITKLFDFLHSPGINFIFYGVLGYLGARIGYRFFLKPGLAVFGSAGGGTPVRAFTAEKKEDVRDKILDTSVIIDGRILDIAETHFIDGPLILPNFVLREIQLISDSSDPIKRARGRRGLDMLNKLQRKGSIEVKITYQDYTDTREVDAKLIKLARDTGGKVVTNDFNLNKVAELQGVKVLNLNNLANALKPVVLPGEEFGIQVIKEGKDENQGIGYLEDGTMVVIENGGHLVGKEVKVSVTSIIQTAAGKMIFTKAIK